MCMLSTNLNKMLHQFWLVQTQNLAEILVSAEIPFVNLNLSRNSAEPKISDLRKISAEIWLRLETFRESGPWITVFRSANYKVSGLSSSTLSGNDPEIGRSCTSRISVCFGTFIMILLRGNCHVLVSQVSFLVSGLFDWVCTKTQNPGIWTVLHCQPTDLHIFDTDPSSAGASWLKLES